MKAPFKRVTVFTQEKSPNTFVVYVNDLENVLKRLGSDMPSEMDSYKCSLERAIFIQQAIDEKIEREK